MADQREPLPRRITENDEKIARRLKTLWDNKKAEFDLNQEEAAEILGITQSAYSQMLGCKMVIHTDMILKIAMMLEVTPTKIDPKFYKRFDIKTNRAMKAFLALEIVKMSAADKNDLLSIVHRGGKEEKDTNKRKAVL